MEWVVQIFRYSTYHTYSYDSTTVAIYMWYIAVCDAGASGLSLNNKLSVYSVYRKRGKIAGLNFHGFRSTAKVFRDFKHLSLIVLNNEHLNGQGNAKVFP